MSTFADIRGALARRLVEELQDVNVYGYAADNQVVPAVIIFRPELIDLRETYETSVRRYVFPVQLRVQRVDAAAADDALDQLIDDVIDAIYEDPTFDGAVASADMTTVDNFGLVTTDEGIAYLACNINVEVLA